MTATIRDYAAAAMRLRACAARFAADPSAFGAAVEGFHAALERVAAEVRFTDAATDPDAWVAVLISERAREVFA